MLPNKALPDLLVRYQWILVTLIIAFVWQELFFFGDYWSAIAPWHFEIPEKRWFFDGIRSGQIRWFYPHHELGHHLANNPAAGLLYLPNWLLIFIPHSWWTKLSVLGFALVWYQGIKTLTKQFTDETSATFAALASLSLGLVSSLPEHVTLPYAALMPWAIYSWFKLATTRQITIWPALNTAALFLLGDPWAMPVCFVFATILARRLPALKQLLISITLIIFIISPHLYVMLLDASTNSRSLGIDPHEALSYSTSPWRIFDWLTPWASAINPQSQLGIGFHRQWWFQSLSAGIVISFLILRGARQMRSIFMILFVAALILISFGQFFPISKWLFTHLPPFTLIRFPERFLIYGLPIALIWLAIGWPKKSPHQLIFFVLILLEALPFRARHSTTTSNSLKSDLPGQITLDNQVIPTRYFLCEHPSPAHHESSYADVRAYQLSMINGTSNTTPPGLKVLSCPDVFHPGAMKWVGLTHVLVLAPQFFSRPSYCEVYAHLKQGEVWQCTGGHSYEASWVQQLNFGSLIERLPPDEQDRERFEKVLAGEFYSDTYIASQLEGGGKIQFVFLDHPTEIKLRWPERVSGLIALPWRYSKLWKTDPQWPIVRLNSSTLGVYVKPDINSLSLRIDNFWPNLFLVISILIQFSGPIYLSPYFRRLLSRKR